ncbi:MAG: dephospho-CoA kinase, long form [Actinobacteria bacterium]|nr:dephospho-CoA kinase, long form [Actinomycetota bacterium]
MIAIGLTGGIGSGKSTVSALLAERGAVIIDADAIVREIQAPGGLAYDAIIRHFGAGIVAADGRIDRAALAAVVFGDPSARAHLERLTHPFVIQVMAERVAAQPDGDAVVVLDVPLLAERGPARYPVAAVVVVDCPVEVAVRRLVERRGLSEEEVRARVAAQASRQERLAVADFVIDNSGSSEALEGEVERAWRWIHSLPHSASGS